MDGIVSGTERMHAVVNSMLDVSRLTSDNLNISPAPVMLRNVINSLLTYLSSAIEERDLHVVEEHVPNLPLFNADPTLVAKAIQHLLVNAIKYTPDGGTITISTQPVTLQGDRPGVEVSIADTGIGLEPEDLDLVLEKYYQVGKVELHSSGKTTFKGGGPGVGLAIARGVANSHGGRIWAVSSGHDEERLPDSVFYFQLPLDPVPSSNSSNGV